MILLGKTGELPVLNYYTAGNSSQRDCLVSLGRDRASNKEETMGVFQWKPGELDNTVVFEFESAGPGNERYSGSITWNQSKVRPRYVGLGCLRSIFVYTQPCSPDAMTLGVKVELLEKIKKWVQQYFPSRYPGIDLSKARICLPQVSPEACSCRTSESKLSASKSAGQR